MAQQAVFSLQEAEENHFKVLVIYLDPSLSFLLKKE
jgi:hypothetical protein